MKSVNPVNISACAASGTHEEVLRLPMDEKRGKILDAPSGEGALAQQLYKMGFDVFCCDIHEKIFKLKNIPFREANLNKDLPYENLYFDYIACVEGIEHIENPHHLIIEFQRILKKGDKLIITTPNILNISSRVNYLLHGWHYWFHPIKEEVRGEPFFSPHITPISYIELKYILSKHKFKIEEISTNRILITNFSRFSYELIKFLYKISSKIRKGEKVVY